MTNALRPSELFGLRWKCFNQEASSMTVSETVYKGKIRPWGKTQRSLTTVHLPKDLAMQLAAWREQSPDPSPEAFIFPNQTGGFLDTDNYRKRVLHKLARDLELPKLTFQVIRRTIATLAQKKGTVKDVQGVMRHSRTATTTDVYMQEIPESVQATVNSIHSELRARSAPGRAKGWTAARRAQASLKSKQRIAAKKIPIEGQKKRGNSCASETALQQGFCNLLPNATKSGKGVSVSY